MLRSETSWLYTGQSVGFLLLLMGSVTMDTRSDWRSRYRPRLVEYDNGVPVVHDDDAARVRRSIFSDHKASFAFSCSRLIV